MKTINVLFTLFVVVFITSTTASAQTKNLQEYQLNKLTLGMDFATAITLYPVFTLSHDEKYLTLVEGGNIVARATLKNMKIVEISAFTPVDSFHSYLGMTCTHKCGVEAREKILDHVMKNYAAQILENPRIEGNETDYFLRSVCFGSEKTILEIKRVMSPEGTGPSYNFVLYEKTKGWGTRPKSVYVD